MLLNLFCVGYFVVRIVSGLLDYSSIGAACIGLWETEGAALVENRAGITFGVEMYVPWDAPEGVVPLGSIPDVIGLTGRRPDAAESRCREGMSAV